MAEYTSNAIQTVAPGESVIFTNAFFPCNRGFVNWRQGTGSFLLSGWVPNRNCCCCSSISSAEYLVDFGANIAVPEDETVGEISLAIAVDGATISATQMTVTPTAVNSYFNVSRATNVPIWNGCCQTLTIRNTSTIPILVQNANIIITRPDLIMSM